MKLHDRTALGTALPVLGCFAVFGWFAYGQIRDALIDSAVGKLEALADIKVDQIDRLVEGQKRRIRVHADLVAAALERNEPGVDPLAAVGSVLEGFVIGDADLVAAHLADSTGSVVVSTSLDPGFTFSDGMGPWDHTSARRRGAMAHSLVIGDAGVAQLVLTQPVFGSTRFLGTLVLRFSETPLFLVAGESAFDETGELAMGYPDQDGNAYVLAYDDDDTGSMPTPNLVAGYSDRDDLPFLRAMAGEDGAFREGQRDYAENEIVVVTRHVDELGWALVAKKNLDEVLGPARTLRDGLLILAGALILLAWGAGRYFGGRLTRATSLLATESGRRTDAERAFSDVLAASPTPLIGAHPAPDGSLEILFGNDQAERLLGRTQENLVGTRVLALLSPESHDRFRAALDSWDEEESDSVLRLDARIEAEEGKRVDVEMGITHLRVKGANTVLVALVDVSERRAAERTLEERAAALVRSNRELDRFAYVASHDLKAPLRAIDQLAGFVQEDAGDLLPDESRDDLVLLRSRVSRLDTLLNGLLEYSRVGRREADPTWVDMEELLDGIRELYLPSDGSFTFEIDGPLPRVWMPVAAVELVFRNLIGNAVKHHDRPEGRIRIECMEEEHHALFMVHDDGPGIPEGYEERIFGLFETLRPRDEVEGGGIGLTMVKKTLEVTGGSIRAIPSRERGAHFAVRMPRHPGVVVNVWDAA